MIRVAVVIDKEDAGYVGAAIVDDEGLRQLELAAGRSERRLVVHADPIKLCTTDALLDVLTDYDKGP